MIYTFGDGFAAGHIWPEWPQMLELVTQQPVKNYGHIGAGNEFIFNCAAHAFNNACNEDIFVVQWAEPNRFDKLLQDQTWATLNAEDVDYSGILANVGNHRWWSTSNSKLEAIRYYKEYYVQSVQSLNRTVLYMIALSKMLETKNINHCFFSTYELDYAGHELFSTVETLPWTAWPAMETYSYKFSFRGKEIQPHPIIHLHYVIDYILPSLNLKLYKDKTSAIIDIVSAKMFEPYYYDRIQQLEDLKNEVSLLFK